MKVITKSIEVSELKQMQSDQNLVNKLQDIQKEYADELAATLIKQTRLLKLKDILQNELPDIARNHVDGWSSEYVGVNLKECQRKIVNDNDFSPDFEDMESQMGSPLSRNEESLYEYYFAIEAMDCIRMDRGLAPKSGAGRYSEFLEEDKNHKKNMKELKEEINGIDLNKSSGKRMLNLIVDSYVEKLDIKTDVESMSEIRNTLRGFDTKDVLNAFLNKTAVLDNICYNLINCDTDKEILNESLNDIEEKFKKGGVFVKNYLVDCTKFEMKDYTKFNNTDAIKSNLNEVFKCEFGKKLKDSIENDYEFKEISKEIVNNKKSEKQIDNGITF